MLAVNQEIQTQGSDQTVPAGFDGSPERAWYFYIVVAKQVKQHFKNATADCSALQFCRLNVKSLVSTTQFTYK
jgi:hypothetical protein